MPRPVPAVVAVLPLLVVTAWLYATGLDRSPAYLVHDEVVYALNANAIAATGRDLSGQFLPLSIYVSGTFFATPVNIYVTALFLRLFDVSEVMIRLPTVVMALANVALVFLIARRMFVGPGLPLVAATLLALTPAHFINGRLGTDHVYLVTVTLAWMLCIVNAGEAASVRRLFAAGAILGAGIYTYLGALVTMPACLLITWAAAWRQGHRSKRAFLAPAAGFALVLLPFVAWHLAHPAQYAGQVRMYSLYDSSALSPVEGARQLMTTTSLSDRLSVYWDYFNPSFLFFAGDSGLINGTRAVGIFLVPMMVLLPIGFVRLIAERATTPRFIALAGLVAAPLAATLVAERYRINRALVMLPFASLVATVGVEALWSARRRAPGMLVVALLALMPLQFAGFYRDYFGDYRARSASWLEYNIAGGLEEILSRQPATPVPVYLARNIQWVEYYWPLYLAKHGRTALKERTSYFDPDSPADVSAMPIRTLVLCRIVDEAPLLAAGLTRVAAVPEPDGSSWFAVLER